jgi:antitoxin (DNA-binding transcriptional repressor) of toxin-antitoxin stability system
VNLHEASFEPPASLREELLFCDATMYHMKTVSVRDLRYDFPKVEGLLRKGEEIRITKRRKTIARLIPEPVAGRPALPDFLGRMEAIFGSKKLTVSGADIVRMDRDGE